MQSAVFSWGIHLNKKLEYCIIFGEPGDGQGWRKGEGTGIMENTHSCLHICI